MAESDKRLMYVSEKEYLDDNLSDVLLSVCREKDQCFEADSYEKFCSNRMIRKPRAQFPTWEESEMDEDSDSKRDDAYFYDLADWVEKSAKEAVFEEAGREQLEQWLTVRSVKINDRNAYIMAPCHPMARLNDRISGRICDQFNKLVVEDNIEWKIKKAVLQDYLKYIENFYVYGTGQVYFSVRKNRCRQAVLWADVGTLTPVSSTRLIEKTKSWVMRNCHGENKTPDVRIAYIGEVTDEEIIKEFYRKNAVVLQNGIKVHPNVILTHFQRDSRREKYIFERQDNVEDDKSIYNFSSLSDMKELFSNFHIVLFLDESYFYKQRQSPKGLLEKGAANYVKWCRGELNNESEWKLSEEEKEKRKDSYYSQIYNRAGLWLNGYDSNDTSKLGFDSRLFSNIVQAVNPECDVYLYISRGETIGDIKLPIQSICNDERYDGKRLLVYRVTEKGELHVGNDDVSNTISDMLQDSDTIASIDLWKFVKSIGSKFIDELFENQNVDAAMICEQIKLLRKTILHVTVQDGDNQKPKLQFHLTQQMPEGEKHDSLRQFVQDYLKICIEEQEFVYVRDYLYNLLMAAMVARANSAKGVFYAYLMRKRTLVDVDTTVYEDILDPKPESDPSRFRARRTIYSAIQGLDQIMIRDMEKRLSILKYEFRYKYCPDVNEETFLCLLDKIHDYCKLAGCTDSPLYLLTKGEE